MKGTALCCLWVIIKNIQVQILIKTETKAQFVKTPCIIPQIYLEQGKNLHILLIFFVYNLCIEIFLEI